jgi:MFS transporter, OFA family, oxalate/formate antiporter
MVPITSPDNAPSRMKGTLVLVAAIAMQLCLGGIYAWSIFVPDLRREFGYSSTQAQLVFGTAFLVFTLSGVVTGALQDRHGPRPLGVASGLFVAAGYATAWAGGGNYAILWLGIGVLVGLGIGCGYVCTIATAVKWFPRRKGLIAGLVVGGYGGGAVLLANGAEYLFRRGWEVLDVLGVVGIIYGPIIILAGLALSVPPGEAEASPVTFERKRLLGDRRFRALCVAMFCATLPGLLICGNLKPIGLSFGLPPEAAPLAVSFFAIGSGGSRAIWGFLSDRFGRRRLASLAMISITIAPLSLWLAGGDEFGFLAASLLVGFCHGSSFAIYPAQTAEFYGAPVLGTVYALVLVAHGLAAEVGPGMGGLLYDLTGSFTPGLVFAGVVAAVGWFGYRSLLGPSRKKELQKTQKDTE